MLEKLFTLKYFINKHHLCRSRGEKFEQANREEHTQGELGPGHKCENVAETFPQYEEVDELREQIQEQPHSHQTDYELTQCVAYVQIN